MVAFSKQARTIRLPKVYTFEQYLRREEKAVDIYENIVFPTKK